MSLSSEMIQGRLITIRTPVMVRRIMIWDMDNVGPFGDGELMAREDGRDKRYRDEAKDAEAIRETKGNSNAEE